MEDREILDLFFARSERAIEALQAAHGAAVRRVVRSIAVSEQDTEECVSDTWLQAWNSIPPARPDPLRTYVCKLARNLALSRYRREHAQKRDSAYSLALDELEGALAAPEDPAKACEEKELIRAVNAFLDTLSYDERFFFIRRYWYADPVKDIAAMARCSAHAVSVRLFRTREKLRKHLEKEGLL